MTRRSYNKFKTTPMAPAGCHTHRHASRESYYKNMINLIHHILFTTFLLAISHHKAYPAKQVRHPLIVVCMFYVAAMGF